MRLEDFDYKLPKELIAQAPIEPRDASRLMVIDRKTGKLIHGRFWDLPNYLGSNDVLVFNDTKVFPARLLGTKETGGRAEILIVKIDDRTGLVEYVGRNVGRARRIHFGESLTGNIVRPGVIEFNVGCRELLALLDKIGHTPLPPYINAEEAANDPKIRQRYQTVYAKNLGSVAAPTAGFHFTHELMEKISEMGAAIEYVTLHVGFGTFAPVRTEEIEKHKMHGERYVISKETAERLGRYKRRGKRIVAVGTTTVRTLESWAESGRLADETSIFIYPGYKFKFVDAMITNFHLPKSTLLMLVSAFGGRELMMRAYEEAVKQRYRFFSFGDASLIV